jgi:peptidyl-prolyl cis-trans isomerase D
MAIINKIRERSGWAVTVIIVALILFTVGGDFFGSSLFGGNNADKEIGQIDGESIDVQEFQQRLDVAKQNYEAQLGRGVNDQESQSLKEQVWQQFIFEKAYTKQFNSLGLKVSKEELVDMVQGNNIHPSVRQQFTNPQTGQFDKNQVLAFLKTLPTATVQQQQQWKAFEESLMKQRLGEKYSNLLTLSSYVTSAEAKKDYEVQVARADAKYLFVPFYSINDSTVKVSDSQLDSYFSKHKAEYQGFDSRSFDYVVMPVVPTKEDSAALYEEIKRSARELAVAANDSIFAVSKSEVRTPYAMALSDMSPALQSMLPTFQPGGVYGPIKDGNAYSIYKYKGVVRDSLSTVRASHILIRPNGAGDSAKAEARERANGVLAQLKAGGNFEQLAMQNSADGSAQNGGDLGYFKNNGTMVKPFENAVFAKVGTGLIPNLVETDFGFHIIKVTDAKSNTKYKIATVSKVLAPSEATKNAIYQKAETFRAANKTKEDLAAAVKKDGKLAILSAERVTPEASAFNTIQNGREIVLWAFNDDTDLNKVSSRVFEVGEQFVIAVVTKETSKDSPKAADFKDIITSKVRNELKAEQITKKIGTPAGTLEATAQKYGAGALVESVSNINMNGPLTSPGPDPIALGKIFGLKAGQRSKLFTGENGVFIVETTKSTAAPEIADYALYKQQAQQRMTQSSSFLVDQAIRDAAKIKDNRNKIF